MPPLPDPRTAARAVYDAVAGFGPLQRHLDDPTVEKIWINEPGRVLVARRGRSELTTTILDDGQVRDLAERRLKGPGGASTSAHRSHSRANMRKRRLPPGSWALRDVQEQLGSCCCEDAVPRCWYGPTVLGASMKTATGTAGVAKHRGVDRLAALSGAASTVAVGVGSGLVDTGAEGVNPTMGPDGILRATSELVGDLQMGASLLCLAAVLLLVFLSPLSRRLRPASEPAAIVAVAGGVLAAALFVDAARDAIALATAADLGDGVTAQVLTTTGWETARILAVPLLAVVGAAVVAGIGSDTFPRWFRWFSAGMLVILVVALAPVGPAGLLGLLGMVWVLVASLVLAADPRSP